MWSCLLCVVLALRLFVSTQTHSDRWKRVQSTSLWESEPLAGHPGNTGSGSHKTKPIGRAPAAFTKGRGFPTRFLHHLLIQDRKGREEQYFFQNLALSDEQRQQYSSTLLEKNWSLYKALHFTENHLPQTQKIWHCKLYAFFSYTYIYIYMYIHIYICVWAHACVYIVWHVFFLHDLHSLFYEVNIQ